MKITDGWISLWFYSPFQQDERMRHMGLIGDDYEAPFRFERIYRRTQNNDSLIEHQRCKHLE